MSRIKVMCLLLLITLTNALVSSHAQYSGTFSGRVWNDINRNGLQDNEELAISNHDIFISEEILISGHPAKPILAVFQTDAIGNYNFNFSTNHPFFVIFTSPQGSYGVTPVNVGNNDQIDSDLDGVYYVTNEVFSAENMDLGLYLFNSGMTFDFCLNGQPPGQTLYVTSGTPISVTFNITNTGETALSNLLLYDAETDNFLINIECPNQLWPGDSHHSTTQFTAFASSTNLLEILALPVNFTTCEQLYYYEPIVIAKEMVVIVGEWADELAIQSMDTDGNLSFAEIEPATSYELQWTPHLGEEDWSSLSTPGILSIPARGPGIRTITSQFESAEAFLRLMAITNK